MLATIVDGTKERANLTRSAFLPANCGFLRSNREPPAPTWSDGSQYGLRSLPRRWRAQNHAGCQREQGCIWLKILYEPANFVA